MPCGERGARWFALLAVGVRSGRVWLWRAELPTAAAPAAPAGAGAGGRARGRARPPSGSVRRVAARAAPPGAPGASLPPGAGRAMPPGRPQPRENAGPAPQPCMRPRPCRCRLRAARPSSMGSGPIPGVARAAWRPSEADRGLRCAAAGWLGAGDARLGDGTRMGAPAGQRPCRPGAGRTGRPSGGGGRGRNGRAAGLRRRRAGAGGGRRGRRRAPAGRARGRPGCRRAAPVARGCAARGMPCARWPAPGARTAGLSRPGACAARRARRGARQACQVAAAARALLHCVLCPSLRHQELSMSRPLALGCDTRISVRSHSKNNPASRPSRIAGCPRSCRPTAAARADGGPRRRGAAARARRCARRRRRRPLPGHAGAAAAGRRALRRLPRRARGDGRRGCAWPAILLILTVPYLSAARVQQRVPCHQAVLGGARRIRARASQPAPCVQHLLCCRVWRWAAGPVSAPRGRRG